MGRSTACAARRWKRRGRWMRGGSCSRGGLERGEALHAGRHPWEGLRRARRDGGRGVAGGCAGEVAVGAGLKGGRHCTQGGIHGKVYGVRGETVEEVWLVDARGKLQ